MIAIRYNVKILLAKLITLNVFGSLIGYLLKNKLSRYGCVYNLDFKEISGRVKGLLFWRLYEAAEINFVQKYLVSDYPVIELGGSLGVVSSVIGKKIKSQKLVVVEANPKLQKVIDENLQLNKIENFTVVNAGIGIDNQLFFYEGVNNTVGYVSNEELPNGIRIPTYSLLDIKQENSIKTFSLVSDIEGAEYSFLNLAPASLTDCVNMIIELHDTIINGTPHTILSQKMQIEKLGFKIIAEHGPVVFASKRNIGLE